MESIRWILLGSGALLLVIAVLLGRKRAESGPRRRHVEADEDLETVELSLSDSPVDATAQRPDSDRRVAATAAHRSDDALAKVAYDAEPAAIEVELDISDDFTVPEAAGNATVEEKALAKPAREGGSGFANAVRKARSSLAQHRREDEPQEPREADADDAEELIVTMHVTALSARRFGGADLLAVFDAQGYLYGDMSIFHCEFQGEKIFSIANMVKPGTFDLDGMDAFETPGITLFMRLPVTLDPPVAFDLLIREARELADALDGQLRDADRNTITRQTEQHLRDEIQQYAFRQRRAAPA